eukprot:TRINITY_DN22648_c0_g1_i1.p2 TRINITY_DN22648_c0_g1~~TRINITY_DN22648_c0_g1_i1.p2  ORF type:complete len:415 (+),score=100.32 TRINITY_DN22648_c0_g1_i1:73-1245(+)
MGGMSHFVRRASASTPQPRQPHRHPVVPAAVVCAVFAAAYYFFGAGRERRRQGETRQQQQGQVGRVAGAGVLLRNGATMPAVGLGTWKAPPENAAAVVRHAVLSAGYRHIDLSPRYANEAEIGQLAFGPMLGADPGLRSKLFIASKLWNTDHHPSRVAGALERTLRDLKLDYLDLWYMHWPIALTPESGGTSGPIVRETGYTIFDTWAAMEREVAKGKVRALGVSNFNARLLKELVRRARVPPAVHQLELHPLLPQGPMTRLCHEHGIAVVAYCPLGSPGNVKTYVGESAPQLLAHPAVVGAAKALNRTPAQVLLRWALRRGVAVIPKSVTPSRIAENIGAAGGGWDITPAQEAAVSAIGPKGMRVVTARQYFLPGQTLADFWDGDAVQL